MTTDTSPSSSQALAFASARVLGLVVSSVTSLVLIRIMSMGEFGSFAAATGVFLLVSSLGYLGADQLLLSRGITSESFLFLTPRLGVLTLLLTLVLASVWPGLTLVERAVLGILGLTRMLDLQRGPWTLLPQLSGKHLRRAQREFVGQVATCLGLAVAVLVHPTALSVACGGLAGSLVVTGWVVIGSRAASRPRRSTDKVPWVSQLVGGVGFASSSIIYSAINAVGLALMPILASTRDVAVFRATLLVYTAALVLPIALNNDVLRPHLYLAANRDPDDKPVRRPRLTGRTLRLNLVLAVVVSLGVLLVGRAGSGLLFGPGYGDVKDLVVPAAASIPFAFVSSYVANLLVAHGRLRTVVWCQLGLLLLAVVANVVLIGVYGALGGAVSLVVVDAAALLLYLVVWHSFVRKPGDPSWV